MAEPLATQYSQLSLGAFSDALASAEPVPGGGSASAAAGALAASLVSMVARLSLDRPKYAQFETTHRRAITAGETSRRQLLEFVDRDAAVYATFAAAMHMPRETDQQRVAREAAIRAAARHATEVPLEVVRVCETVVQVIESLAGRSNVNASSDLDVAALLAQAAARGAGANVTINLPAVGDEEFAAATLAELEGQLHEIESTVAEVHAVVQSGTLRSPEDA
jgi:methenyltetrahydrofolate cyclohydrolase